MSWTPPLLRPLWSSATAAVPDISIGPHSCDSGCRSPHVRCGLLRRGGPGGLGGLGGQLGLVSGGPRGHLGLVSGQHFPDPSFPRRLLALPVVAHFASTQTDNLQIPDMSFPGARFPLMIAPHFSLSGAWVVSHRLLVRIPPIGSLLRVCTGVGVGTGCE